VARETAPGQPLQCPFHRGRVAQWESARFTRERSQVRNPPRPFSILGRARPPATSRPASRPRSPARDRQGPRRSRRRRAAPCRSGGTRGGLMGGRSQLKATGDPPESLDRRRRRWPAVTPKRRSSRSAVTRPRLAPSVLGIRRRTHARWPRWAWWSRSGRVGRGRRAGCATRSSVSSRCVGRSRSG
jgi:hypothetical protein